MQINRIMSHPPVTCPLDGTLEQPARLMWEFDCGIVPVVSDDGRLAGVVTDRDICMAAYFNGKSLCQIPVGTAMAHAVIAIHEDENVDHAAMLMRDNQVRRLPVIDDDGRPIGVVSLNDLTRFTLRVKRSGTDRELVQTMAAVREPRAHAEGDVAPVEQPVEVRPAVML